MGALELILTSDVTVVCRFFTDVQIVHYPLWRRKKCKCPSNKGVLTNFKKLGLVSLQFTTCATHT